MGQGQLKMGDLTKACGVSDQVVRLYERMGLVELQGMKDLLQSLRQACDGEPGPVCPVFLKLCMPPDAVPDPKEVRPERALQEARHAD